MYKRQVDAFGFDVDFTDNVYLPLLRPIYKRWFRVEVRGVHHLPDTGGALLVSNHSGTIAIDSLMTQLAIHAEHPAGRHLRICLLYTPRCVYEPVSRHLVRLAIPSRDKDSRRCCRVRPPSHAVVRLRRFGWTATRSSGMSSLLCPSRTGGREPWPERFPHA